MEDDTVAVEHEKRPRQTRNLDNPLRQWAQDHCNKFLAEMSRREGRRDHARYTGPSEYRCSGCLCGGELLCSRCMVETHRGLPFHKIERWTGSTFERMTLKKLGLRIQLGHWHGKDRRCPLPMTAANDDFVIIEVHGVHEVHLDYLNVTMHFLMMTKDWRNWRMLKRAGRGHDPGGVATMKPGECALLCTPCPHPGKNLPADWQTTPEEKQFLYVLFVKDPGLCNGWAFYGEVVEYMTHVKKNWKQKQDRSHCVAHDVVNKLDYEARGTASSGISAVDCAHHNMKRPDAVGDLQLGERYLNMDYMFFSSIAGTMLMCFFVSYDIACQWHINIWEQLAGYVDDTITINGRGKFMTFLVPKFHLPAHIEACNLMFSFNLTPNVGRTDGEAPERGWAHKSTGWADEIDGTGHETGHT
ncbi:hypothetical protein DFH07DRAFT_972973 [Mycena maculata]|uniref:CxC2-like cysteine cluster KDZ transposase-associated domain-containing protein n=1 Tax=Mycena maculata TaxID=230809 RepID=A0AAD7MIW1_9AGAR|nr:hypothetical protein DFH07DRAFT_972973 [Mycena maculata]